MEQGGRRNSTVYNNNNYYYRNSNNYDNNNEKKDQCLTMHQPWASLLIHGIKRIEGRSWNSPLTGRLWIHAASKVPDNATIKTMEEFYREIYARDGITDLEFPQNYPVSRLIGCIEVVGCLRRKELACWKEVPQGVRLESLTDFCWLCEHPQKLSIPLQMGGWKGVYDLDSKIDKASIGGLIRAESPLPFKFPLPNPEDPFSLKPGSLSPLVLVSEIEKSPELSAIIDAASQAATQFSNKAQSSKSNGVESRNKGNIMIPEDVRFVRNDQYIGNNRFDNRNQRHSSRPAAIQYVRKEQNMESNHRVSYNSMSTPFVQSHLIDGNNSLGNNLSAKWQIKNEHNLNDNRSTLQMNEAATGRKNPYTENYRLDNRNQRYSTRPVAMQYVKKEQNLGSIDGSSSLGNNSSTQCKQRNEENVNDHISTPKIFAAAVRGLRPVSRTS